VTFLVLATFIGGELLVSGADFIAKHQRPGAARLLAYTATAAAVGISIIADQAIRNWSFRFDGGEERKRWAAGRVREGAGYRSRSQLD
jgi:hypothetical protein